MNRVPRSPSESAHIVAAFRQRLPEAGFVEGQIVAIESRFAEGNFDRLPALAADLVRRQVYVLVATGGTVSVVKAKPVVPAPIPIVFAMGGDPVQLGVVASLARPSGNITGVSFLVNELAGKTVELLHELVPMATVIGFLVNPKDPNAESDTRGAQAAADAFGLHLVVAEASTASDIESTFTIFVHQQVAALFVDTEPFFTDQRAHIVALAARHALPAVYQVREFAAAARCPRWRCMRAHTSSSARRPPRQSATTVDVRVAITGAGGHLGIHRCGRLGRGGALPRGWRVGSA